MFLTISSRTFSAWMTLAARRPTITTAPVGHGLLTHRSRTGNGLQGMKAELPTCVLFPGRRESKHGGEIRDQYIHAVDIVPTIYEMLGITPPGSS